MTASFFSRFKLGCFVFLVLLAHSFATIANMQWFSEEPSPLNGMVGGNHWDQWFSDGFGVRQPLETMVFDGCAPLVRRWNGYVPSSKSTWLHHSFPFLSALVMFLLVSRQLLMPFEFLPAVQFHCIIWWHLLKCNCIPQPATLLLSLSLCS